MTINKDEFKASIVNSLRYAGTTLEKATKREMFDAVSKSAMDIVTKDWLNTKDVYKKRVGKKSLPTQFFWYNISIMASGTDSCKKQPTVPKGKPFVSLVFCSTKP